MKPALQALPTAIIFIAGCVLTWATGNWWALVIAFFTIAVISDH